MSVSAPATLGIRRGGALVWAFVLCALPVFANAGTSTSVFRVHLLGTGNPMPSFERFGNATLVQAGKRHLLVDAGRGTFLRLGQVAVADDARALLPGIVADSVLSVEQVFLTHLHSDHVVGLPDLWLSGWLYRQDRPLHLRGPAGTVHLAEHLEKAFEFDIRVRRDTGARLPGAGARILAHEISEGVVFEDGGLVVTAILVDHAPVEPAYAYRIDFGGRSVVISGDTRPSESLIEASKSADVLIHEVIAVDDTLAEDERIKTIVSHHTTARRAGEVFARSQPRLAVFSHIVLAGNIGTGALEKQARESWKGPLWTGADLDTIEIGEEITVLRGGECVLSVGAASR